MKTKKFFAYQWHITDACDQRCKHCYIYSDKNNSQIQHMTFEEMLKVISNVEDMCEEFCRVPYFYITGGDPILHPDFWRLLEVLNKKKYKFTIMGNPFHLDSMVCRKLKECGCEKYQLSLDGMQDTHDFFRKRGSFDSTIKAISYIRNAGIKCAIMSTVSEINIKEIPSVVDLVVKKEVDIYAFGRYCSTSNDKSNGISPLEYRELLDTLWKKYQKYKDKGVNTYFNLKDHLWKLYLYEEGVFELPTHAKEGMIYEGCHCANNHISILPNGDAYACRRFKSKVGNVFEEKLKNIFLKNEEKYRDFNKFVKCGKCELLGFCRGCPAVSYGDTGDFYGEDPQCWKSL